MRFDDIFQYFSGFGSYQKRICFIIFIPAITAGFHALVTVFMVALPDYRCAIPGLENDTYAIQNPAHNWTIHQTIPAGEDKKLYSTCHSFDQSVWANWTVPDNFTEENWLNWPSTENFTSKSECKRWVFDKDVFKTTVTEQMSLVCGDLIMRSHLNSIFQGGIMVGSLTLGIAADIYGRKTIMCISLMGSMLVGIATTWAPEYISLCFSRFLLGAFGSGYFLNAFTMGIELVAPSKRMWTGMIIEVFWVLGEAILVLMAYFIREWHYLQLAISVPSVLYLAFWWLVPESPRWLLANGRVEEAEKIIQKAAKVNKVIVPEKVFDKVEDEPDQPKVKLWQLFTHRTLFIRAIIIFFNWIVVSMVYYGLSLNSGYLYGGVHLNFFLSVVVEAIGYGICFPLLNVIGRKPLHAGSMIIGGVACSCTIFTVLYLSEEYQPVTTALALLGKLGASAAFAVIYIYSSELFPTVLRNGGMGISSMSARVGSMSAPYIADLGALVGGNFGVALPLIIFGGLSVAAGVASLWLPETLDRKLPETIDDAIHFGKKQNKEKVVGVSGKFQYDNPAMTMDENKF